MVTYKEIIYARHNKDSVLCLHLLLAIIKKIKSHRIRNWNYLFTLLCLHLHILNIWEKRKIIIHRILCVFCVSSISSIGLTVSIRLGVFLIVHFGWRQSNLLSPTSMLWTTTSKWQLFSREELLWWKMQSETKPCPHISQINIIKQFINKEGAQYRQRYTCLLHISIEDNWIINKNN